jgi:hypothetical protein
LAFSLNAVDWTGNTNYNWNLGSNWSTGIVPDANTPVNIPVNGLNRYPSTAYATGSCSSLQVQSGASVTVDVNNLYVTANATFNGRLNMTQNSFLRVGGDINWQSGATVSITHNDARIYCLTHMSFSYDSNVQFATGTILFEGSTDSRLVNHSTATRLFNVYSAKSSSASLIFYASSTSNFVINGALLNISTSRISSSFVGDITVNNSIDDYNSSGGIQFGSGTLIMGGVSGYISFASTNSYLYRLRINSTGTITLLSSIKVNGDLIIASGTLNSNGYNITVSGDWSNTVGTAGFIEGTGTARVIFTGIYDRYILTNENFNIIELNKSGGSLISSPYGGNVTCNAYDWTAGMLTVQFGTLTINDMVDNGIFGSYSINGVLNITNNDGYIDMNCSMTITEGTVNVYGGTTDCDFGWGANVNLNMSGGNLVFHNRGIRINPTAYTHTYSLTGGIISTVGSFQNGLPGFSAGGNHFLMMKGTTDATITMHASSNLNHLVIMKDPFGRQPEAPFWDTDREGNQREVTRANRVVMGSNLVIAGNLSIDSGTLMNSGSYLISVAKSWSCVYGTFQAGTGTVVFNGDGNQLCLGVGFNILQLNKTGGAFIANGAVECNSYDWEAGNLTVNGGSFTALDMADALIRGVITLTAGSITFNQDSSQYLDLGGTLNISGGTFTINGGSGPMYWPYIYSAAINMSAGVLNIKDMGVYLSTAQPLTENITGGTINIGRGLTGQRTDFSPSGGTICFTSTVDSAIQLPVGSYLNNVTVNKISTREEESLPDHYMNRDGMMETISRSNLLYLNDNLLVAGDLIITAGTFNPNGYTVEVHDDILVSGTIASSSAASTVHTWQYLVWNNGSSANCSAGTFIIDGRLTISQGANVVLPAAVITRLRGNMANISINEPGAQLGSLELTDGADITYSYNEVPVLLNGYLTISADSSLDMFEAITVTGDINLYGELAFRQSGTIHGKIITAASSILNILCNVSCDNATVPRDAYLNGTVNISSSCGMDFVNNQVIVTATGDLNMTGGVLKCDGLIVESGSLFEPEGGTVEITSNLAEGVYQLNLSPGSYLFHLRLNTGTGVMLGNNLINIGNLYIQSGTLDVSPVNYGITLYGNWANTSMTSSLIKRSGTVTLMGTANCFFTGADEHFYRLVLNKIEGAKLYMNDLLNNLYCDQYEWINGGVVISHGTFTSSDLINNGIPGTWIVLGGIVTLTNNDGYVDLNGDLTIENGEFHVYGGTTDSYWPFAANASITMSGGVLDFHNRGIYIYTCSYTLATDISGGLIRCAGGFYGDGPNFAPTGGTIELYGSTDGNLYLDNSANSRFYNLRISKPTPRADETPLYDSRTHKSISRTNEISLSGNTTVSNDLHLYQGTLNLNRYQLSVNGNMSIDNAMLKSINATSRLNIAGNMIWNSGSSDAFETGIINLWGNLVFNDGTAATLKGDFTILGDANSFIYCYDADASISNLILDKSSDTNTLTLGNNFRLDNGGSLQVSRGKLNASGNMITNPGATAIGNGGTLYLSPGSIMETGANFTIAVDNGGRLECAGTAVDNVILRPISGNWAITTQSGATISATYTVFNGTQAEGILVVNGVSIDPANSFSYCTFQHGKAGSAYLTINNSQSVVIPNSVFLTPGAGSYNVAKTVDYGTVTLNNATGAFAGPAYENDIYNRITWTGYVPNLKVLSFICSNMNPYIGDLVNYTVTVLNDSDNPVSSSFNVHFFKNRSTPPGYSETSDIFHTFAPLSGHANASYSFTGLYSMTAENWSSYALIDPEAAIAESNETDNREVLQYTSWQALPAVADAQIQRIDDSIRLSWSYPISANRYKIYWDADPYGSYADLLASTTDTFWNFSPAADFRFYRIVAERDVPIP